MIGSLAVALIGAALWGTAGQQPVFRSRVDLVTVDVTVLGPDGKPVPGLTAADFEVVVDGRPRRIVWAEFVSRRPLPAGVPANTAHFSSNEDADTGQLILIAVDQAHIRRTEGLAALRAAAEFVDALDPSDHVAAITLNQDGPIQFTTQHGVVKRALQRLTGEATATPVHYSIGLSEALAIADGGRTQLDQVVLRECGQPLGRFENLRRMAEADAMRDPCPVQVEQEGRALAQQARTDGRITLDALRNLIERLGTIDGPKTLVLLSEGLVAEPRMIDLTSLGAAAQAARVTIHVLQLETPDLDASTEKVSPTLYADRRLFADGLERLAGAAKGGLFRLVGSDPYPFRKILSEISAHYLLAFAAEGADTDGRVHRIGVRVRPEGVTIRARPSFQFARERVSVPVDTELVKLLKDPREAADLPLRIAAYTFRADGPDSLHVLLAAETDALVQAADAATGFVLIDAAGVIAASGAGLQESGRYVQSATVPPGRYTLKAAAISGAGRRGSVQRQVDLGLRPLGAARVSGLMLADPAATSGRLVPLVRDASRDAVVAYLELYADASWDPSAVRVQLQVAREASESPEISREALLRPVAPGRWKVDEELPLRGLPPGTYRLSVRITLAGETPLTDDRGFVIRR